MSSITTLNANDLITNDRAVINTNFSNLNTDKIETSVLDTDTTLSANSDSKIATQKAVKTYVDAGGNVNASTTTKGIVEEATQAEVTAQTTTGGTGARLFVNPSATFNYLHLPTAYSVIGETILGADATSITVSSIPTRKDLLIVFEAVGYSGDSTDMLFRFNSDSGANYAYQHSLNFSATPVTASAATSVNFGTDTSITARSLQIRVANKATIAKTAFYITGCNNGSAAAPSFISGIASWNNTADLISSVTVLLSTNNILSGSRLTVYGAN